MTITATDLFAGAGGSSTGAAQAGVDVVMAANHWRLAVDTHQMNHPETDHDCADLSQVTPSRYPRTHLLLASPECTWHSGASGRRRFREQTDGPPEMDLFGPIPGPPPPPEAGQRSRATMWDVPRFAEHHRYPIVIVENVVEAITKWEPARSWLGAMDALGYAHEIISHNSMHAQSHGLPAPQSRDRVYIAFWDRRMKRPAWESVQRPQAWCRRCEKVVESAKVWKREGLLAGKYRTQYIYSCTQCGWAVEPGWLPAAAAIDWGIPAQRIGDRKRPLAAKTRARVLAGLQRYGTIHLEAGGNQYDVCDPNHPQHGHPGGYVRAWPLDEPLRTLHGSTTKGIAFPPLLVPVEGRDGKQARPVDEPLRTQTTRNETALLMPYYGATKTARPVSEAMGTLTTVDRYALVVRQNSSRPGNSPAYLSTPVAEPLRTLPASNPPWLAQGERVQPPATDRDVDDCLFRMLEPHEQAAGMGFPADYKWGGSKRERTKMAGNAVTPPIARDLNVVAIRALESAA